MSRPLSHSHNSPLINLQPNLFQQRQIPIPKPLPLHHSLSKDLQDTNTTILLSLPPLSKDRPTM
ncbi:hypothetical protein BJX65DRAFT_271360 [Aspergillus insuetus]